MAIGAREAGIGPMVPPAGLTSSALVGHASSVRCLSVRFRPAISTGFLLASFCGNRFASRDATQCASPVIPGSADEMGHF